MTCAYDPAHRLTRESNTRAGGDKPVDLPLA
jgi:hypothetical protein